MKNYKKLVVGAALTLFTAFVGTSCHDQLNIIPEGQLTLDDVFTSDYNTAAYLNSCYEYFPAYGYAYNWRTNLPIIFSDDGHEYSTTNNYISTHMYGTINSDFWSNWLISDSWAEQWGNKNWSSYRPVTSWSVYYQNIKRCNIFLANIDTAVVPDDIDREAWKAEALTLRSFYYHRLISDFGDVPLILDVISSEDTGANLERTPATVICDSIVEWSRRAIAVESDDFAWFTLNSGDINRMNKAVAAMLMSRAALYKASPLYNDGGDYWAEAAEINEEALNACLDGGMQLWSSVNSTGVYTLATLIGSNNPTEGYDALAPAFYEYMTSARSYGTAPVDKETIMISSLKMGTNINTTQMGIPQHSSNKAGICPSQELVDAYPTRDGKYILDLENPYNDEAHLDPNYNGDNTMYDPENPYANRDPRFYATILYNGAYAINSSKEEITIETYNGGLDKILPGSLKNTCTGYYSRRHMRPDLYPGSWVVVNYRTMRLAEIYLNCAEAMAKCGRWEDGLEYANVVRARATMPDIEATGQEDAVRKVCHERRIEFGFEDVRYMDIRRWAEVGENIADAHMTGMWIEKRDDGTFEYHRAPLGKSYDKSTGQFSGSEWQRDVYKAKYQLHPIELDEVTRLVAATGKDFDYWQNPGW
ncbi:MAG: RagB/SusD family nutrient uptake outer membrane protein [Rikenellaceae bacterium]